MVSSEVRRSTGPETQAIGGVVRLLCEVRLGVLVFGIVSTLSDAAASAAPAVIAILVAPFSYIPARSWSARGDLFSRSGVLLAGDLVATVTVIAVMGGSELMIVYGAATVALLGVMVGMRLALLMATPIAMVLVAPHGSAGLRGAVALVGVVGMVAMAWAGHSLGAALRAQASTARELVESRSHRAVVLERVRIARDLHDTVAGDLAGMVLLSQALRRRLDRDGSDEGARRLAERLDAACRTAHRDTRIALGELRRVETGSLDSLVELCRQWSDRTGVVARVRIDRSLESMCPALVDDLGAMVRELLENVRRHAAARNVEVELTTRPGEVVLRVADDGVGVDRGATEAGSPITAYSVPGHFGLVGIHERSVSRGGRATISGAPGRGTVVEIALPGPAQEVGVP